VLRRRTAGIAVAVLAIAARGWSQAPAVDPVAAPAEKPAVEQTAPSTAVHTDPAAAMPASSATTAQPVVPAATVEGPAKKTYTVPAGTKVLLQIRSAVNTKSAKPGDGVYLASTFPVVVGTRVMIPAGVYVQGTVDNVIRAGRMKGRAQLNLHFSSIIFPNGTVVEVPGIINSLPGSSQRTVDGEGKVEEDSNKGRDVANAAKIGLTGATVGTIGGAATGHPLEGAAIGGLSGAAVGAVVALFTRGDDINIETGTPVEMILQRPLILEEANLTAAGPDGNFGSRLVPAAGQQRPLDKPTIHRARVVCPPGGLGCG
jgi:hypothetical protein